MKEAFVSCFASDLELFVMKKQEAGFHYGSQVHILRQLGNFHTGSYKGTGRGLAVFI